MNILDAVRDHKVFGQHFRHANSWMLWMVFLCALFALPMTPEQLALDQKHTGRNTAPTTSFHEAWLICRRRAGKSFILSLIAVFLSSFKDWRPYLGPGECGTVMVVAADRRQARVIMRYCLGLLQSVPMLKKQIVGTTLESITLRNNVVIEVHTASFRTTRGYTILAALFDEMGYWPTDENASQQDAEVLNAVRPGMATIPEAMLLCASSPHARKGALWTAYSKHFAKDGDPVLVWQAATREMNPSVPQAFIDQHMAEDEARAKAEYGAVFRTDLEAFVTREKLEPCVSRGIFERAYDSNLSYSAFTDPAGGGGVDSMALAVGHFDYERRKVVVDCLREVKPQFSPELAVQEFCETLASYQLKSVVGDRYANLWPVEVFAKYGVTYEQCAQPKATLYQGLLPLINSGRIDLLDHSKTNNQLLALERNTTRVGREHIDHPQGQHDDLCNCIAGLAMQLNNTFAGYNYNMGSWLGEDDGTSLRAFQAQRLYGALNGVVNAMNAPSMFSRRRLF